MHLLQITVGAIKTPLIPTAVVPANSAAWSCIVVQNNSGVTTRMGDSSVSATKGIVLSSTPLIITPSLQYTGDLMEFFLFGAGAVIDILVLD